MKDIEVLTEWYKKYKKAGYTDDALRKFLIQKGFSKDPLDAVIHEEEHKFRRKLIAAGFMVILVVIIATLPFLPRTCYDENCFVAAANACETAVLDSEIAGAVFQLKTSGCVLSKYFKSLPRDDPSSAFFRNAAMQCKYEKGKFNTQWLRTTSNEGCTGELAELFQGFN